MSRRGMREASEVENLLLENGKQTSQGKRLAQARREIIKPRNYKTFFMLNSAEHEILNAHKYKSFYKIQLFSGSDKASILFVLLINFKMPTIVGILTFMGRK